MAADPLGCWSLGYLLGTFLASIPMGMTMIVVSPSTHRLVDKPAGDFRSSDVESGLLTDATCSPAMTQSLEHLQGSIK